LDLVIFTGAFQFEIFYDSMICTCEKALDAMLKESVFDGFV